VLSAQLRRGGYEAIEVSGSDAQEASANLAGALRAEPAAVVAVGGDGTVNVALQLLAGTTTPLGVLPAGAGDDFARALGVPTEAEGAIAGWLRSGQTCRVDLGRCGQRWFATVLASGIDSQVSQRAATMSWPSGRLRYVIATAAELRTFRPVAFELEVDGRSLATPATLVAVANTAFYGGGMKIAPPAVPTDGMLDVVVVGPMSKPKLIRSFPRLYRGTHTGLPEVSLHRGRRVVLRAAGLSGFADGDLVGELPLEVDCIPGALIALGPGR
jgi:diacylglycerol kinase (ATP)